MYFIYQQQIYFVSLVKNCNHKGLGIYYLLSAFIFGISGTLISVLIRIELYSSGNRIISPENQNFYNISITLHGFLMIFFLVMPGLFGGFGNYFIVIFQGSPEVVYPRVNNFSILILSLSYLFLILSLISEFGGGTGWTLYPPLSTSFMSLSPSSTGNLIFGLLISGISSCLTSVNFWTTILNLRSYYLTLKPQTKPRICYWKRNRLCPEEKLAITSSSSRNSLWLLVHLSFLFYHRNILFYLRFLEELILYSCTRSFTFQWRVRPKEESKKCIKLINPRRDNEFLCEIDSQ